MSPTHYTLSVSARGGESHIALDRQGTLVVALAVSPPRQVPADLVNADAFDDELNYERGADIDRLCDQIRSLIRRDLLALLKSPDE